MSVDTKAILERLREALPEVEFTFLKNPGPSEQDSILVSPVGLVEVCRFLRDTDGLEFDLLSNVTGVDWPDPEIAEKVTVAESDEEEAEAEQKESDTPQEKAGFLEVVYHLYSISRKAGPLVLRARTQDRGENNQIASVVPVYRSAEFQEREVYDLFGVNFTGHPDLRRILMWDEFVDHPMRKDYVEPDDYEYEPTPHADVLEKAKKHYPASS